MDASPVPPSIHDDDDHVRGPGRYLFKIAPDLRGQLGKFPSERLQVFAESGLIIGSSHDEPHFVVDSAQGLFGFFYLVGCEHGGLPFVVEMESSTASAGLECGFFLKRICASTGGCTMIEKEIRSVDQAARDRLRK